MSNQVLPDPIERFKELLLNPDVSARRKIRAILAVRGETIESLSKSLGRSHIYVSKVLAGERESLVLKQAIARHLNVPEGLLWPEAA